MTFEIKACSIDEMHRHPMFHDRTQAKVRVMLRETHFREVFDHNLTLKVWADTNDEMTPAEIKTALLTKAAAILKRTVKAADLTNRLDPPVSIPTHGA